MLARPAEAHHGGAKERKANAAPQPPHDSGVWHREFCRKARGEALGMWPGLMGQSRRTLRRREAWKRPSPRLELAGCIDDICAARGGGRPRLLSGEPRLSVRGGWKPEHQKNAHSNVPPHKPRALTSSRASRSRLALECRKTSPLRGCSLGSTSTSVQTSLKSEAVRSRISLCRAMVNPPLLHVRAWQLSNGSPHAQCEGRLVGSQPYRRAMASRNAPLCRGEPMLLKGPGREPRWGAAVHGQVNGREQRWRQLVSDG